MFRSGELVEPRGLSEELGLFIFMKTNPIYFFKKLALINRLRKH